MKKKVFLVALMVALFACLFVISVSAADNIIKLTECPTLEQIHANPNAYVSHLDAFDADTYKTYREADSQSVIVLTDYQATPTYYVFPAYYLVRSNYASIGTGTLNTALQASEHATSVGAFSNYASTGNYGKNVHFVRIELPTYVTHLNGNAKFEDCYSLKEIYFPIKTVIDAETGLEKTVTCVTTITGQNTFSNCTSLTTIHNLKYLPKEIINAAAFSGCKALTSFEFPAGVTSVASSLFNGCSSLVEVKFPEGVTSIGSRAFKGCSSMKTLVLPNSVTTIGKCAFEGMSKLEVLNLGAGAKRLSGSDNNMEVFVWDMTSLKYVYMPACFASEVADTTKNYNSIFTANKFTIFFTGSEDDFGEIVEFASQYSGNDNIKNALVEKYDPTRDYEGYAKTKGKIVVAWGYSACEAFYDGNHELESTTRISADSYVGSFDELCNCQNCSHIAKINENTYAPIFEFLGYSASMTDGNVCVGYSFDKTSYEAYNRITGKNLSFGVVGIIPPQGTDMSTFDPVNNDLTPYDNYTILANITDQFASFDFIITGFSSAYYDVAITMCAFVADGSKVDYVSSENGKTVQSEYATTITFNSVLE